MNETKRWEEDIYRIEWRKRDTGTLDISGVSMSANHGPVTDPEAIDWLRRLLPDFAWNHQYYDREIKAWVTHNPDPVVRP